MASSEIQMLAKRGGKWVAITGDGQQVVLTPGIKLTVGVDTMVEEPDTGEVKSLYDCYHDGTCPPDLQKMLPPKVEQVLENAPDPNAAPPPMGGDPSAAPPTGLPGGPNGPGMDALMGGMPPAPGDPMASPPPPQGM